MEELYEDQSLSVLPELSKNYYTYRAVVSGGSGGTLAPPELGSLLTLFQPEGVDYAHHGTVSIPGFENLTTYLKAD